jgi:hypothetical protein
VQLAADSDNLGFLNICNEVKGLLFAVPPQIERISERRKPAFDQTKMALQRLKPNSQQMEVRGQIE